MFISKLQLTNFKRFTDLTIDISEVTPSPKLVLLIGANGSGKSCIFDAFEAVSSKVKDNTFLPASYYRKNVASEFQVRAELGDNRIITRQDDNNWPENITATAFYGRSSLRHVPQLTRIALGQMSPQSFENDFDRPRMYIERDNRFENDFEEIAELILEDAFKSEKSALEIQERYIVPINAAFGRIFGEDHRTKLTLLKLIPPLNNKVANISFRKGDSVIHYNYLGNGEKEVFNILINLLVRTPLYQETVYYLDEIDLHLNTKLQYDLLKELVEHWLPDNCQLWTASHSLGFIEYANQVDHAVIVDFDDFDFDQPQTLFPQPKDRYEVFEIAVPKEFLSKVVEGKKIVFAENTDTPFYNGVGIENTIFFTAIDKNDVFFKARNLEYHGLIDRDFLNDAEIQSIRQTYTNLFILNYYSIENYFFHPDNLEEYFQTRQQPFDKSSYMEDLKKCKNKNKNRDLIAMGIISARNSYPFFREHKHAKLRQPFLDNARSILELLQSDDVETFYKVFPAKDYCRQLLERRNLSKEQLSQTEWFKGQLRSCLFRE